MSTQARTYGGWRRRRGLGLFGLGLTGTLVLLATIVVVLLTASISITALVYVLPPAATGIAVCLVRIGGIPVGLVVIQRVRWWRAASRGYTRYRAGVVVEHPRAFQLPGVLAPLSLLSAEDGFGSRYGLVWDRRTGLLTATLRVVPTSTWLANREDADGWVANWGGWLATLGAVPMVRWVTVCIDTAPEPGSTLADSVAATLDPTAPAPARAIMNELVDTAPGASADVDTTVSITFDPKASPAAPKDLTAAVTEVGRTLQGLESALGTTGVTVLGRATATDLAGTVRAAFDPASRGEVNRIVAAQRAGDDTDRLGWHDAGPVGAEELPDRYVHDSGHSVTWAWHEAPRSTVHADVLARLVSPTAWPKRVALQIRPFSSSQATRVLEAEVNAAVFRAQYRRRTGRDETARDEYDQARARQAAAEEAQGAGVVLVSMYVTVTVTNPADLPRAIASTEASADASKIRLRPLYRSQAAGFAVTLPCGICPQELSKRWPN